MKDIRVVGIAVFGALAFATCAAKAETVVWYDFDGLGEAGTSVPHGTTILHPRSLQLKNGQTSTQPQLRTRLGCFISHNRVCCERKGMVQYK